MLYAQLNLSGEGLVKRKLALECLLRFEEMVALAYWDWGILTGLDNKPETAQLYLSHAESLMEDLHYEDERKMIVEDIERLADPHSANVANA
jgi:hypothetical protein